MRLLPRRLFRLLSAVLVALMLGWGWPTTAPPRAQTVPGWPAVKVELVTDRLNEPLYVTHAGDGSGRLFGVERKGRVVIVRDGVLVPTPFLDLTSKISWDQFKRQGGGLLSVAFHPDYADNGFFYVHYTPRPTNVVVARYQVSADNPDVADVNSAVTLLDVEMANDLHHGGLLSFGPDGYLYVGLGDGSRRGDPRGPAQQKSSLLGKLLRLAVDGEPPYSIPPDNPFVGDPDARPEVWAYGLRNPWRFSFDRANGDLYIGDVGQASAEEIDFQRAGTAAGRNYGWSMQEGRACSRVAASCDREGLEQPIVEYDQSLGCAVVGGYVYRGPSFPGLTGLYLYGDFCSGRIWGLREQADGTWQGQELLKTSLAISSFGEDEVGDVYVTSLSDGGLYRLTAAAP